MNRRNSLFFVLAIITLLLAACSGGRDTLSVAKISPPVEQFTVASDLGVANFGIIDIAGLMREALKSPELMGCLTSSMDFHSLLGTSEPQPTAAEMELMLPCFDEDQLDSIFRGPADLIGFSQPMV